MIELKEGMRVKSADKKKLTLDAGVITKIVPLGLIKMCGVKSDIGVIIFVNSLLLEIIDEKEFQSGFPSARVLFENIEEKPFKTDNRMIV